MKIIRFPKVALRRTEVVAPCFGPLPNPNPPPGQRKRALLVGINYIKDGKGALKGPHNDIMLMKELLIKTYGYHPDNIITLVDKDDVPPELQPTRANMLKQIGNLVRDVVKGDRLFFHFAGHTSQTPTNSYSEEDGMDECIIPCDGEEKKILDNELRRQLVDVLPAGCHLVAIFDSCHSESLLDLEHVHCNRVYVPWVSKGRRRSATLNNQTVRRQALDTRGQDTDPTHKPTHKPIPQNRRVKSLSLASRKAPRKASVDGVRHQSDNAMQVYVTTRSLSGHHPKALSLSLPSDRNWFDSNDPTQCDSPVAILPCDGFCPRGGPEKADVVSLSSCKDSQISWEDGKGHSMTVALVMLLKKSPNPALKDLMLDLSHTLYRNCANIHTENYTYHAAIKAWLKRQKKGLARGNQMSTIVGIVKDLDTVNFQDPQLASHQPLDLHRLWDL